MPIVTIVQAYIFAALEHAISEQQDDETLAATVPELPGIVAYGVDAHECARELYRLVEETVRLWLVKGYQLPVLDGIDLNSEKGQILASYHDHLADQIVRGDFCQDEDELDAAFQARRKTA